MRCNLYQGQHPRQPRRSLRRCIRYTWHPRKARSGFYISYEAYAFFQQAVADKGTEGNYNKDLKEVTYLGYPVYPTSGIPNSADAIVFTYPDNIVVGTNAYTGNEAANLIPAYQYDGSDNVKVTMNFAVGCQRRRRR
jgi:hypothetical protein